ncbi:MAG: L-threonylcarbamoyladenylate synthase [Spirochaetia bacterium]
MTVIKKNRKSFGKAAEILTGGGVAVLPCDTIYGFSGTAPGTEDKIRRIKGRDETKPFLILLKDESWLSGITEESIPEILTRYWPGPLTVIVRNKQGGTTGVRIPDDPYVRELLGMIGEPLFSTSVNRSGSSPLWRIEHIIEEFKNDVDLIIDDGDKPDAVPSTIVDASGEILKLIRPGAVDISSVLPS